MSIRITAIVCTHNRASYLEKAIRSLIAQSLPKEQYEVMVVDNASTDGTRSITERYPVHYIFEPVLGLSQARNTGWRSAKGEYVAYLDDDAIADPGWLQKILEAFESIKPQPGVIGGKVDPIWEAPRPAWLSDNMLGQLTLLDWGPTPVMLSQEQWFVGANMAFPRKVLEEISGFKTGLGRKGGNLLSMEENLARLEIEKKGYKCYYDPLVVIQHHILPSRLTKKWFLDRAYWNGVSSGVIQGYMNPASFTDRLFKGITTLLRIVLSPYEIRSLFSSANDVAIFRTKRSIYARLGHVMALWGVAK